MAGIAASSPRWPGWRWASSRCTRSACPGSQSSLVVSASGWAASGLSCRARSSSSVSPVLRFRSRGGWWGMAGMGWVRKLLFVLALVPAPAFADPSCFGLCSIDCVKPLTIPDRWDDVTITPGTAGWAGNNRWDTENFSDANGNGIWDPGEPFVDGSSRYSGSHGALDGSYNAEFYDPLLTGYVAEGDAGRQIALHGALPSLSTLSYYPLILPGAGGGSTE